MSISRNRISWFARASLGFSLLFLGVASAPALARKIRPADPAPKAEKKYIKGRVGSGTELIAFFIASSTCGASQNPNLPGALKRIRSSLSASAAKDKKRFIYAGVAVDEFPATGLKFLEPFGPFDELMTGGSWLGSGSVDFMIRGVPGPLALPQVLIIERDVKNVDRWHSTKRGPSCSARARLCGNFQARWPQ